MDEKPFFEFNILDFNERDVEEPKKFSKSEFDLETILTTANDLKYTRAIQARLAERGACQVLGGSGKWMR